MQSTLAVGTGISLYGAIALNHLSAEGDNFILLDLERDLTLTLSIPQISINPTDHLYSVPIFSADQTKLITMMLKL